MNVNLPLPQRRYGIAREGRKENGDGRDHNTVDGGSDNFGLICSAIDGGPAPLESENVEKEVKAPGDVVVCHVGEEGGEDGYHHDRVEVTVGTLKVRCYGH